MKKILFFLLFLISFTGFAQTTWYIDPAGSDVHGKGTISDPWASLKHATDTVTFAGDTIYINAGNYTISTQVTLADSVHLMGAGATTVITSTITGSPYYAIKLASTEGTIGNQSISYLKIIGGGTAFSPLGISGRSKVEVHHCTFENFYDRGVCFSGTTDFTSAKPTIFATGNSFHDNVITNCATGIGYSRGNLNIGGQSEMLIENNTIHQNDRGAGNNGFGIKALYYGYNKGLTIRNNSIYVPRREGSEWDFSIELLHNLGGIEIYNNDILGRLDVSATTPPGGVFAATDEGGYGFALKIYDNLIGHDSLCSGTEVGIDLEHDITGGVYIYRNHIRNVYKGIALTMSGNQEDVYIYYNLIDSIGQDGTTQGQGIGFSGTGSVDNLHVYNNVILGHPDEATLSGIYKVVAGNVTNSSIRNNIFRYFDDAPMDFENATFNNVSIENNIFYGNGSSNNITWTGTSKTAVKEQNNLTSDPLFVGGSPYSYQLQATSPAINAGLEVGLSYDFDDKPIYLLPDIGAYEFGTFPASSGLGWKPKLYKENIKDTLNINKAWKIKGETVTTSARSLNRVEGVTSNIQEQLNNKNQDIADSLKVALDRATISISRPDSGLVTAGGYTTGFDWENGIEENIIKAAKTVTTISPVLARPIVCIGGMLTGQTTLTDGRAQYVTFYIPEPTTITGVRFVLQTQGDYTADNYNGAKLYKVTSASTFARLDSTANNGNFWKGSVVTKNDFAFTGGARLLEPGLYVVGFIWNASATTAAPVMYTSFNNSSATNVMYFGNGGVNQTKFAGYLSTQTDLAVNEAFNDLSSDTVAWGIFLY